jgi:hypothetical protein
MNAMTRLAMAVITAAAIPAATAGAEEATTQLKTAVPAPVVTAPVQTVDAARLRLSGVQTAIRTLDEQIALPRPVGLTRAQVYEWQEHGAWLSSLRERYANFLAENGGAFGDSAGLRTAGADLTKQMAAMNIQFDRLQETTQTEARRYQTLSNASKARHEVAMNAIRNLK